MGSSFCIPPCENVQGLKPWVGPAILLVDLDAFYASVEQREHPGWKGLPVIVGGSADRHGVVSTCSYEARAYGVRSAMPASQAAALCPNAIWTPGNHKLYKAVSDKIMAILVDESPLIQQVSIDEAFLDITNTRVNTDHPAVVASRIQRRVREEQGVTCSVGIGTTKTIAKIASDIDKPFGLTMVEPGREIEFLRPLPIRTMSGIGGASEQRLIRFGIKTLGDLAKADETLLRDVFGKNSDMMRRRALGIDFSPVETDRSVKSMSSETTFSECLTSRSDVSAAIQAMATKVGRRMRKKGLRGTTVVLKVRLANRQLKSAQGPLPEPTNDDLSFAPLLEELLDSLWSEGTPIRLVGVGVTHLYEEGQEGPCGTQGTLFDLLDATQSVDDPPENDHPGAKSENEERPLQKGGCDALHSAHKRQSLLEATDAIKDRFGDSSLLFGHEIHNAGNTTGTIPK